MNYARKIINYLAFYFFFSSLIDSVKVLLHSLHFVYKMNQLLISILVYVNIFANCSFHNLWFSHKISSNGTTVHLQHFLFACYTIHFLKAACNILHSDSPGAIFHRWVSPYRTCDFFYSRARARAVSLRDSSNFVGARGATRRPPNAIKVAFFNWLSPGGTSGSLHALELLR